MACTVGRHMCNRSTQASASVARILVLHRVPVKVTLLLAAGSLTSDVR